MTEVRVDLKQLTEKQLDAFHELGGHIAVALERERRSAYATMEEACRDLFKVGVQIETMFETIRHTSAVKMLKEVEANTVIRRLLAFAKHYQKVDYETPAADGVRETVAEGTAQGVVQTAPAQ